MQYTSILHIKNNTIKNRIRMASIIIVLTLCFREGKTDRKIERERERERESRKIDTITGNNSYYESK